MRIYLFRAFIESVATPIKHHICALRNCILWPYFTHTAIIKLIPVVVQKIFAVGGVVTP